MDSREIAVELNRVGKMYKIYSRPVDRLLEIITRKKRYAEFWALRDVSFAVRRGESVGIIGLNGSGKSTVLQIIAGVTKPTCGTLKTYGRISALLELGIGFHPELTGRENVRMAASLIGAAVDEETEKAIEDFSELGEFFDRPVKTYSSGMFVRLAFSLAVNVDPDILIIDEALSVGDQYFQKKSFDKILEFREKGKTLLFCSHSMYHVQNLCSRAIWLHNGQVRMDGPAHIVCMEYENFVREQSKKEDPIKSSSTGQATVKVRLNKGGEVPVYRPGEEFSIIVNYVSAIGPCHVAVVVLRNDNTVVYGVTTEADGIKPMPKEGKISWTVPELPLLEGEYRVYVAVLDETGNVILGDNVLPFRVMKDGFVKEAGICRLRYLWCEGGDDGKVTVGVGSDVLSAPDFGSLPGK